MTLNGTIHRTAFLLLCVVASALWAWNYAHGTHGSASAALAVLICALAAGVLVWITVWKKQWSVITAPVYALLEGLVLGDISGSLETRYPGIAIEAVALTFAIFLFMLFVYRSGLIRVTERFNTGLVVATGGVVLFYFASLILSFYGVPLLSLFAGGVPGIMLSVVVVAIAAFTLVAAFDFIEQCASSDLPKYMEWYTAFGLILTLVWLYMELLSLLSKAEKSQETGKTE
jgi:uncharacterized YccA/Bax inhibitor family protein